MHFLFKNIKKSQLQNLLQYLVILVLNFAMLYSGYYGEVNKKQKLKSVGIGFVFFFLLYGVIYMKFLHNRYNRDNSMIFWAFVVFWAFYGVIYEVEDEKRNIGYNVLDLFSKCFVGIFFWAYFTKTFTLH